MKGSSTVPMSWRTTRSAMSSNSVGSRLMMMRRAPLRFAIKGKPAAGFPLMAKRNGAKLAIINREATEFDEIADLVVRQDIGTVLESFIVH